MNSPRLSSYRKGLGKAHIKFLPWSSGPGERSTLRGRLRPWRRGARRNGCIRRLISKQLFISQKRLFPIPALPVRRIRLGLLSSSAARKNISWLSLTRPTPLNDHNQQGVLFLLSTCLWQRAFFLFLLLLLLLLLFYLPYNDWKWITNNIG